MNKKTLKICLAIFGIILIGIYYIFQNTKEEADIFTQVNEEINTAEKINTVQEDTPEIIIHLVGEVNKQGILTLKQGSRIADAIALAGGLTGKADMTKINLAQIVEDGEMIIVPGKEEQSSFQEAETLPTKKGKVNINTATQEELETLDGIGETMAKRIIEYRKQNGKFKAIEELKKISGIGESKFSKIKEKICI